MFIHTRTTVSCTTGETLDNYHSEPEFGNAEDYIDHLGRVERTKCCVVQAGNSLMIVEPHQSTLIYAQDVKGF